MATRDWSRKVMNRRGPGGGPPSRSFHRFSFSGGGRQTTSVTAEAKQNAPKSLSPGSNLCQLGAAWL